MSETRSRFVRRLSREQRERHVRQETEGTEAETFIRRQPLFQRQRSRRQVLMTAPPEEETKGIVPQKSAQDIHLGQVKDPIGDQGRFVAESGGVAREGDTETQTVQEATRQGFESSARDLANATPTINLDLPEWPEGPQLPNLTKPLAIVALFVLALVAVASGSHGAGSGAAREVAR